MFSKEEARAVLNVLDYEVHNGGFIQYWDNILRVEPVGYLDRVINLVTRAANAETPGYDILEEILMDLRWYGSPDDYFDEENYWETCSACDGLGYVDDYGESLDGEDVEEVEGVCSLCEGSGELLEVYPIDGWSVFEEATKYLTNKYVENAQTIRAGHEKVIELVDIHNIM